MTIVHTRCGNCGEERSRDAMAWDAECNYPGPFCRKCDSDDLRVTRTRAAPPITLRQRFMLALSRAVYRASAR